MMLACRLLFLVLVISINSMSQTKFVPAPRGTYGGQGVTAIVDKDTVRFEYDCATGRIAAPLVTDRLGKFSVDGFYKRETPGPVRLKFRPKEQPARLEGSIVRGLMRFKVVIVESGEVIGEFTARLGRAGVLRKCR